MSIRRVKRLTILAAGLFMLVSAIQLASPGLYLMAAAMFCLLAVAYAVSRIAVIGLACERPSRSQLTEGERVEFSLTVRNRGRLPRFGLILQDTLPSWLLPVTPPEALVPLLRGGRSATASYRLLAGKRGVYSLGPVQVIGSDPLGLFRARRSLPGRTEVVVHPSPIPLGYGTYAGGVAYGGLQVSAATLPGDGVESHSVREYMPGDELRRIHWKSTARRSRLAVIEFDPSLTGDLTLVLDMAQGGDVGSGRDTTVEYAVTIAASLAMHAVRHGLGVSLSATTATGQHRASARRGDEALLALDLLARVEADGPEPVSGVLTRAAEDLRPGATLVLVLPMPRAEVGPAVEELIRRHVRVIAVLLDARTFVPAEERPALPEVGAVVAQLAEAGATPVLVAMGEDLRYPLTEVLRVFA
jgi:uncharacterized repeat protein (TIGR01451 family)